MLTVTFATHNGALTLPKTLKSIMGLDEPAGGWKLVVVDNASTDDTPRILQSFEDRLPMTVLNQPARGKNRALNMAIPSFEGDLVVFTDDDVVLEKDWLVQLRQVADEQPEFDIFGGRIAPIWPHEPPDWFLRSVPISIAYAVIGEEKNLDGPIHPGMIWGPNMAIRKHVFDQGHRFDDSVGPQGGQYRMGSETEFTIRIAKQGHKAWHCSAARVGHIVRPHQMDPEWVIGRAFRFGRDMFWKENDPRLMIDPPAIPATQGTMLFGLPRWVFRRVIDEAVRSVYAKLRGDLEMWLRSRWDFKYWQGYLKEAFSSDGRALMAEREAAQQSFDK